MPRRKSAKKIIDGLKRDLEAYGVELTRPAGSSHYVADVSTSWEQAQVSRTLGENVSDALRRSPKGVTVGRAVDRLEMFFLDADESRRDTERGLKKKHGPAFPKKAPAVVL
jgi:hypothetical protein